MKIIILFFSVLWFSLGAQSHGFDYSVMTLTERDNNRWSLQIKASLDAFRKEVKQHFSESPYKTPEQFSQQLLEHITSTLKIVAKDKSISLGEGTVSLGHETSVFFKEITMPVKSTKIQLINGALKDIYRHTTKLLVVEKNSETKSFILTKSNNFTIRFPIH